MLRCIWSHPVASSTPKHQRNARPTCYSSSVQLRCVKFRDSVQNLDFDRFLCINARKYCSRFLTWNEWPKRIDEPTYYRVAQKCSKGGKILGPPSGHRPIAPQEEIVARKGLTTAYNGIFIKYLLCVCFDVSCPCNFLKWTQLVYCKGSQIVWNVAADPSQIAINASIVTNLLLLEVKCCQLILCRTLRMSPVPMSPWLTAKVV